MRRIGWVITALGTAALDDRIKQHMEMQLPEEGIRPLAGGWLHLRKYHNKGAMLDLGSKKSGIVRAVSLCLTLLGLVLFVCAQRRAGRYLQKLGLSLLLGGAISNTKDRLLRGYVVDYLVLGRGKNKPGRVVYNLSDFAIMFGAVCLAADALRGSGQGDEPALPVLSARAEPPVD
ncbi:MAG: signal peptidase II [Lachnospiraceae bacterium]|nr:signal peptidase II [Lachnospiraceae bacterium]